MTTTKITEEELEEVQYAIKDLLQELQSDSIDMSNIREALAVIHKTATRVAQSQAYSR